MAESVKTPPFLPEHHYLRTKAVRVATASKRPSVGLRSHAWQRACAHPPWHSSRYEVLTNDEPRHQPARPETRPSQRLCVSLGSPPSVAVGSLSARAAHRSRAPQITPPRMTWIATPVKNSRFLSANRSFGSDATALWRTIEPVKHGRRNGKKCQVSVRAAAKE